MYCKSVHPIPHLVAYFCLDLLHGSVRKYTATSLQVAEPASVTYIFFYVSYILTICNTCEVAVFIVGILNNFNVWNVSDCHLCLPFISNPTTGQINMPQLSSYLSPLAFLLSPSHSGLSVKIKSFMSYDEIR